MSDDLIIQQTINNNSSDSVQVNNMSSEQILTQKSSIGKAVNIKGDLAAKEDVFFDGRLEGTIMLKHNQLEIGPSSQITANLFAKTIIIEGELKGDAHASEQIILKKSARVLGNLYAADICIDDGAIVKGFVDMQKSDISNYQSIFESDEQENQIEQSRPSFIDKVLEITHRHANNPLPEPNNGTLLPVHQKRNNLPDSITDKSITDKSLIGETVMIKGEINSEEDVVLLGRFEGVVYFKNNGLFLGNTGQILANTFVKFLIAEGELKGDIFGNELVNLKKTAHVTGRIHAPRVTIESGATLKGSIEMEPQDIEKAYAEMNTRVKNKENAAITTKKSDAKDAKIANNPKSRKNPLLDRDGVVADVNTTAEKFRSMLNPGEQQ